MRRMMSQKQIDYVNDLSEQVTPRTTIGTYPNEIENCIGSLNFDYSWRQWENNSEINFATHTFSGGAYFYFFFPGLLEHYGLGEDGNPGYMAILTDSPISFPETINTKEALKNYIYSEDFIEVLNNEAMYCEEEMLYNEVASYMAEDVGGSYSLENENVIIKTYVVCSLGQGEKIIGATDPVLDKIVSINNFHADTINANYVKIGNSGLKSVGPITTDGSITADSASITGRNIVATQFLQGKSLYIYPSLDGMGRCIKSLDNQNIKALDITTAGSETEFIFGGRILQDGNVFILQALHLPNTKYKFRLKGSTYYNSPIIALANSNDESNIHITLSYSRNNNYDWIDVVVDATGYNGYYQTISIDVRSAASFSLVDYNK